MRNQEEARKERAMKQEAEVMSMEWAEKERRYTDRFNR